MYNQTERNNSKPSFLEKTKSFLNRDVKSFLPAKPMEKLRAIALTALAAGSISSPMNMVNATTLEGTTLLRTEMKDYPLEKSTDSNGNVDTAKLAEMNSIGRVGEGKTARSIGVLKSNYDEAIKIGQENNPNSSQAENVAKYTVKQFKLDTLTAGKLNVVIKSFEKTDADAQQQIKQLPEKTPAVNQNPSVEKSNEVVPPAKSVPTEPEIMGPVLPSIENKIQTPVKPEIMGPELPVIENKGKEPAKGVSKPDVKIENKGTDVVDERETAFNPMNILGEPVNAAEVIAKKDYKSIIDNTRLKTSNPKKYNVNGRYVFAQLLKEFTPSIPSAGSNSADSVYSSNNNSKILDSIVRELTKLNPDYEVVNKNLDTVLEQLKVAETNNNASTVEVKNIKSQEPNRIFALAAIASLAGFGFMHYNGRKIENGRSRREMAAQDIAGGYNNLVIKPLISLRNQYTKMVIKSNEFMLNRLENSGAKISNTINELKSKFNFNDADNTLSVELEKVNTHYENKKSNTKNLTVKAFKEITAAHKKSLDTIDKSKLDNVKKQNELTNLESKFDSNNGKIKALRIKLNNLKGIKSTESNKDVTEVKNIESTINAAFVETTLE